MTRLGPCLRLAVAVAVGGAPLARPAQASPWSGPSWLAPAKGKAKGNKDSPEALLEQAQAAYDDGRYRESGDLAAAAYDALPLSNRASPYGENAVFQATGAYREAWLRSGDTTAITAAHELLQRHVDDYAERGRRDPPSTVLQELERMRLLGERCRDDEPQSSQDSPVADDSPPSEPTGPTRSLRRGTAAAFFGGAALGAGAGLLAAYVFGYIPSSTAPGELVQVTSVGHLVPSIPLALAGGVASGLGMHALIDGRGLTPERRRKVGVGLTVAGAALFLAGGVLLGTGAAFWPAPENGMTSRSRANLSVNLQSAGLATMLASLGILGPGIGALATPHPDRGRAKR